MLFLISAMVKLGLTKPCGSVFSEFKHTGKIMNLRIYSCNMLVLFIFFKKKSKKKSSHILIEKHYHALTTDVFAFLCINTWRRGCKSSMNWIFLICFQIIMQPEFHSTSYQQMSLPLSFIYPFCHHPRCTK